jgi:hypothetical protein
VITFLQELSRRRWLVLAAFFVSVAVGVHLAYNVSLGKLTSKQKHTGIASARLLVNTQRSIAADLNPYGSASLQIHSQLLADLIASTPIRNAIAADAGIPAADLVIVPPAIQPLVPTPLAQAAPPPVGAESVSIAADETLPVVSINAQAQTPARAAVLAQATIRALVTYLATLARTQNIPKYNRIVITPLGPAVASEKTSGISPVIGAGAAIGFFLFLCYLIVFGSRFRQAWRRHADELPDPAPELVDDAPSRVNGSKPVETPARSMRAKQTRLAGELMHSSPAATRVRSASDTQAVAMRRQPTVVPLPTEPGDSDVADQPPVDDAMSRPAS